jgi:pterin-4a-carbinolamine dehydratase
MSCNMMRGEAADEIERLNKLVTTWIICAERLVESQEGEAYDKALNFYRDCQRIANETCK